MELRKRIRYGSTLLGLALTVTALLVGFPQNAQANCEYNTAVEWRYYSDETKTNQIGWCFQGCDYSWVCSGSTSDHYAVSGWACPPVCIWP